MGYRVVCSAGCGFEGSMGTHRGEKLALRSCPNCGSKLKWVNAKGSGKRGRCVACNALSESVVPANLGPVGIAESSFAGGLGQHKVQVLLMAKGGECVCWRHRLLLADGSATHRVKPDEEGHALSALYDTEANLQALAEWRAKQA